MRQFYARKEGLKSFRELVKHSPIAADYASGKEIWDSEFDAPMWARFMDYWQIDRAVVQTSPPGFDGLAGYRFADEKDLQAQAAAKARELS